MTRNADRLLRSLISRLLAVSVACRERLGQVAVEVAARVGGRVQDENSAPFSAGEAGQWRQRCLSAMNGAGSSARLAD